MTAVIGSRIYTVITFFASLTIKNRLRDDFCVFLQETEKFQTTLKVVVDKGPLALF